MHVTPLCSARTNSVAVMSVQNPPENLVPGCAQDKAEGGSARAEAPLEDERAPGVPRQRRATKRRLF